jgi:prolipoprotein diacylglyceryltransferase
MAGVERWFIETIRVNTQYHFAGMEFSQAQLISVILIAAGGFGIWYLSRNRRPEKA